MNESEFLLRQAARDQHMSITSESPQPVPELPGDFAFRAKAVEKCFYIGIDFGTTYSGVSWAWSGDPENIKLAKNWPGRVERGQENAKAPTRLQYHDPSHFSWGYDATSSESVEWFKLLLLDRGDIPLDLRDSPFLKTAQEKLRAANKTPEDAVADYLRMLWDHAISSIKRDRGQTAVNGLPFKVVITIPAVWKPYAEKKMRDAAQKAGILAARPCGQTTLDFVQEPEAAALATLREFQSRDRSSVRNGINVNDIYVICDCGGGTVDVITYKVSSISPLEFGECVRGDCKLCGAIFVDEGFEKLVKDRLGTKWSKISPENKKRIIESDWEYGIKRLFSKTNRDEKWSVPLPIEAATTHFRIRRSLNDKRNKDVPIEDGRIQFSWGHVNGVFQKSINGIRRLVNSQISKAIILVGGFGACNYLYETLVSENKARKIEILQPTVGEGPWAAICRGAVIRASEPLSHPRQTVTSRVSRYHYGILKRAAFNARRHEMQDRRWCTIEGVYKAYNQMDWYLSKNADVSSQQPVQIDYYWYTPNPVRELELEIYYSDSDIAPTRKSEDVRHLCSLRTTIDVDFSAVPTIESEHGEKYYKLNYEVKMIVKGTSGSLDFATSVNGILQDTNEVIVELQ